MEQGVANLLKFMGYNGLHSNRYEILITLFPVKIKKWECVLLALNTLRLRRNTARFASGILWTKGLKYIGRLLTVTGICYCLLCLPQLSKVIYIFCLHITSIIKHKRIFLK